MHINIYETDNILGHNTGLHNFQSLKSDPARFWTGEELGGRQGILDTRDHLPEEAKLFLKISFAKLVLDP